MSILVKQNSTVEVVFYYKIGKGNAAKCITAEYFKSLKQEKQAEWTKLSVTCKILGFKASNDLQRDAMKGGLETYDYIGLMEKRLSKIVMAWDAKDDSGKIIPVTADVLANLHPAIANSIIRCYDMLLEDNEDLEGAKQTEESGKDETVETSEVASVEEPKE